MEEFLRKHLFEGSAEEVKSLPVNVPEKIVENVDIFFFETE